ncbi:hypothetical protein B0H19DRAFT_1082959 [Mycena capillaripes]|nr:hypothetical protein B0H19DRAFT_1082959 [Mycena capillaripes]
MHWLFTTEIPSATKRISHFMGFHTSELSTLETQFAPALIFNLWRDGSRWPKAQRYLRETTIPCAHALARYSNRIIASPHLRVRLNTLTIRQLRELLHPTKLIEIMKELECGTTHLEHPTHLQYHSEQGQKAEENEEDVPMPPTSTGVEED